MKYDVIIIGAGPSGIFCAYELLKEKPDLKVLMLSLIHIYAARMRRDDASDEGRYHSRICQSDF